MQNGEQPMWTIDVTLTGLSVLEINSLAVALKRELHRRRHAYIVEAAKEATITREEAGEHANKERVAYSLPLGDWALVQLVIAERKAEMAKEGCVAFWPIITPTKGTRTSEYEELFGKGASDD